MDELRKKIAALAALSKTAKDAETIDIAIAALRKARKKTSDEYDPNSEQEDEDNLEDQGFREFDPDQEGSDDADKWLEDNDPKKQTDEDEEYADESDTPREVGQEEEEPANEDHEEDLDGVNEPQKVPAPATQAPVQRPVPGVPSRSTAAPQDQKVAQQPVSDAKEDRFPQPTKEDIAQMREYTRPWVNRARDQQRVSSEAHKNPILRHQGDIVEARNQAHQGRQEAYDKFTSSPEYQNADFPTQMEMEAKFDKDYHEQNPQYLKNAITAHEEAHKKGSQAGVHDRIPYGAIHGAAKQEQLDHIIRGGAQSEDAQSMEAAMQHAGGEKGEDGTTGSIVQDKAAGFAAGNRDFLDQYKKELANRPKSSRKLEDMMNYNDTAKKDVERIIGKDINVKNPESKKKAEEFFSKYYPLIGMSASRVMNKLGLDSKRGDIDTDMLHEAGMHGLFQSINDYDHDHPSKANFATHAGNKIRGLMQTALRAHDEIPAELRAKAKKFNQQQQSAAQPVTPPTTEAPTTSVSAEQTAAPKPDVKSFIQNSGHPKASERADRLSSTNVQRAIHIPKPKKDGGQE
jgi:hypothetical protein